MNVVVPAHLADAWVCWRLWLERKATLTEITTTLSIEEILDANEALDVFYAMKAERDKMDGQQSKRRRPR